MLGFHLHEGGKNLFRLIYEDYRNFCDHRGLKHDSPGLPLVHNLQISPSAIIIEGLDQFQ